ncbi:MAG: hypothetical protein Q7R98_00935 [Candidatus Jorgensenbacteria bacterium]|nr:hypothetical protein [Candidatus Jorgensenbacteria bacterium]
MRKPTFYFIWGAILVFVIALFAGADYILHSIVPEWSVPDYYFRNKLIFGFLLSIPALFVSARYFRSAWSRTAVFSAAITILLQARYFIEGYPIRFIITFLFIHFAIIYILSAAMFFITGRYSRIKLK